MQVNTPEAKMTAREIEALCRRLEARAESCLLKDQPQQQSDMRTAARLLRETISVKA